MIETKYLKVRSILLLFIISSLVLYVILRAYNLSFTHDESLSFKIITGDAGLAKTANNHFLNTWLMYVFYSVFGGKEIFLRMPNVLAFIVYACFAYKILIKAENIFLMLAGIPILLLNPYLLDFFCLARGYGLSLGFGLAAIYYLFRQRRFGSAKEFIAGMSLALFFSLLSAYANLVCINLNIALLLIFMIELYSLVEDKTIVLTKKWVLAVGSVLILNLFFLLILIKQLLILKAHHELYFGGDNNFIDSTLTILIHRSIYASYYGEEFWKRIRQLILVIFTVTVVYQVYSKKHSSLSKITTLLIFMSFATVIQHYTFDALYPIERTSLIFIPLFALFIYYLISAVYTDVFSKKNIKTAFSILASLLLCLPLGWHMAKNLNLKFVLEWRDNADTKNMMKKIVEQHKNSPDQYKTMTISNTWFFEPCINYYRALYSMDYLEPANRDGVNTTSDFIYCTEEDREKLALNGFYTSVSDYPETKTSLFVRSAANATE